MNASTFDGIANMAANPFGPRYERSRISTIVAPQDSTLTPLLHRYEQLLNSTDRKPKYLFNFLLDFTSHVLDPDEIQRFLVLTTAHERHPLYPTATGGAITQLIRNAQAKHNVFALDFTGIKPPEFLCGHLEGSADLRIYIRGNAGDAFAANAQYGTYIIEEASDVLGLNAKFGTYFIRRAGNDSFWLAQNAKVYIEGGVQDCGVSAEKSTFVIRNSPTPLRETVGCTFYREESVFGSLVTKRYTLDSNHPTKTLTLDETIELWDPFNQAFKEFDTIFGGRQ